MVRKQPHIRRPAPSNKSPVDSLDRIWLMTDKNLAMLSSTQTTTLDYPEQWFESSSAYTEFIITDKNTTWIATENFVASQNGFGWAVYDHNSGIPHFSHHRYLRR